jgi:hypothetical protein
MALLRWNRKYSRGIGGKRLFEGTGRDTRWIVSDFFREMNEANRVKLAWVSGWSNGELDRSILHNCVHCDNPTSIQIPPDTWPSYLCGLIPRRRQSIRTAVYPRVLNKQRRAAWQLLFVEDNTRTLEWLVTSNLASKNNTLSLSTLYCVGDVIMSAMSNNSSRHGLSSMYPGVKSVVW